MNIHEHPGVPRGAPNGSKGILWAGSHEPPLGSRGDPMGSNLGIPGFPHGIQRYPQEIPGPLPGIPGMIIIHPRDPRGVEFMKYPKPSKAGIPTTALGR